MIRLFAKKNETAIASQLPSQPPSQSQDADSESTLLRAHELCKFYGDRSVVQNVSFTLNRGEVLGFLGPNGAGKTTTIGMLYGAIIPSQGFVQLNQWRIQTQGQQARYHLGIVPQEDNLDPELSVFENLTFFAHYYRLTGKNARQRAGEVLAQVGLQDYGRHKPDELSGGLKRRAVLARALLNRPQVVFLDEPTTGLDPDARQDFWKLVTQLKQEGCGILLTTHYMDEVQRLCDRLLLLQQGQIIDQGTPSELIERIIGKEIVEITGVDEAILRPLAAEAGAWCRSFGSSYLLTLPPSHAETLWQQLVETQPSKLTRRHANLEDVFLRLTGASLQ
ncbi:MAG: ABC transporter ATP-binding protein [Trichocoleus desertorum ATA4-8-CV12]|jgi:lipooligosaccharide transport system ATP-binding protein|nr:ABC transporter ATP-binding protein [Trichocoleus desertorum ATA4-8-CV12]